MSAGKIDEAKRRLLLPELMKQLGLGTHVNTRGNARCPFHDDQHPSFSIFQKDDGTWHWHCFAGCGSGDEIDLLAKARGLSNGEAIKEYLSMAGVATTLAKPRLERSRTPESAPEQAGANKRPVQPRPLDKLLDAISEVLRRYVVFQFSEQAAVIALWVVHTWVIEAFDYTAYLHVHSAEKRSGKSRLLDILDLLVKKPWRTAGVSLAALFRKVERVKPTLLYDEIDTVFSNSKNDDTKDVQGFLNAGFERGAKFSRCVGQNANLDVHDFEPFCPKALSGIGKVLPDTTADRCIPIELVRQAREEKVERFRKREAQAEPAGIRAELEAWSQRPGVVEKLRDARPELPDQLTDRQQDISEPLLAIADLAGREWSEQARAGLVKLCSQEEDASKGIKLLVALRSIFDSTKKDKLTTRDILEELVAIEDGPWALMFEDALKHDKLQTAASKLARMLKEYKIKPRTVKLPDETTAKGYHRRDFEATWKRYLPASCSSCEEAVTAVTAVTHEGKEVTATIPVTASGQKAVTQLPRRQNAKGYEVTAVTALPGKEQKVPSETANDEPSEGIGPLVYPGDWLRHSPENPLPAWASVNLEAHCELCGEAVCADPHWFISRTDFGRVRCPCCQEAEWSAQGFEVEDGFPYGDWQASAEVRIAEQDRAALQKWGRWLKTPDGQALLREANTQWWEALQPQERLIAKQAQQGPAYCGGQELV